MASVRDIAIIVLAIESIVVGVLLAILTVQVSRLVKMLREEIKPMLEATQETVGTVRGTSTFLSETVVSPVVRIISTVTGLRRGLGVLSGMRHRDEETKS